MFNFNQFLADSIHENFVKFQTEEAFKYAFVLVYMFLYFQGDKLKFALKMLDDEGNQQLVIFWTTLVMKEQKEYSYKQFIELFVNPALSLLSNNPEPRINEEIRKIL